MAVNQRRQICATKRKRLVHDRRKKVVVRRHVFYKLTVDDHTFLT